jgi:hypothetical protein
MLGNNNMRTLVPINKVTNEKANADMAISVFVTWLFVLYG